MAAKYEMDFLEVSAKDGTNIKQLFNDLGTKVYRYVRENQDSPEEKFPNKRISLHNK